MRCHGNCGFLGHENHLNELQQSKVSFGVELWFLSWVQLCLSHVVFFGIFDWLWNTETFPHFAQGKENLTRPVQILRGHLRTLRESTWPLHTECMRCAPRMHVSQLRVSAKCSVDVTRTRSTQLVDATPLFWSNPLIAQPIKLTILSRPNCIYEPFQNFIACQDFQRKNIGF